MKTEAGGMRPQAKERLEPPDAGEARRDPSLEPLEGAQSWPRLDLRFLAPRTLRE